MKGYEQRIIKRLAALALAALLCIGITACGTALQEETEAASAGAQTSAPASEAAQEQTPAQTSDVPSDPAPSSSENETGEGGAGESVDAEEEDNAFAETLAVDASGDSASVLFFSMDTVMQMAVYGPDAEDAVRTAAKRINRLDQRLAAEREDSEVAMLNAEGEGTVSDDVIALLKSGQEFYRATDGDFNIALYPLKKAWGLADGNYRVPDEDELVQLCQAADPLRIRIGEDNRVEYTGSGLEIDLGGIAKGYASDAVAELLRETQTTGALVSLGGNVCVYGAKPDGSPWRIGIQDPEGGEGSYVGVVTIDGVTPSDGEAPSTCVVTSGPYERYFEMNGKRYHHILDPATGYPAESGLISVTIVSRSGTEADVLSTAVFVMGLEDAEAFWKESRYDFDMILLDTDGVFHVTPGIADRFTSDYPTEVIGQ